MSKKGVRNTYLRAQTYTSKVSPGTLEGKIPLGKNVARVMMGMRLSGKTKEECDAWLESVCQVLEQHTKEISSGKER